MKAFPARWALLLMRQARCEESAPGTRFTERQNPNQGLGFARFSSALGYYEYTEDNGDRRFHGAGIARAETRRDHQG